MITYNVKKTALRTTNPIAKGSDGKWYFANETWSDMYGPYETYKEAFKHLKKYFEVLVDGGIMLK